MLNLAWKNLVRRPLRSALTVIGIVIGTTAYMLLVAMSHGMREQAQSVVDIAGADVTVARAKSPVPWMSSIARAEVARLREIDRVESVSEVVIGTTRAAPRSMFLVFGVDPRQQLADALEVTKGRMPRAGSVEMIVGEDAAVQLDLRPGDAVDLAGRELAIVGVFRTGRGLLDAAAVVDLGLAQSLFGSSGQVNLALVRVRDAAAIPAVIGEIERRFPRLEATPSVTFTSRFDYLNLVTAYARVFALLALLIAAVMIANTISMNVFERRQEIAILRSLGWAKARVAALILGEGALMIVAGAGLAVPLSASLLQALSGGDAAWAIPSAVGLPTIAEGISVALVAGIACSSLPLVDALRAPPLEALRAP